MTVADYYKDFKCKCGACRRVCCGGWGITVSADEYFRLIGLECGETLRDKLDVALAQVDDPSPERYAVMKPSYTGKCRLINDEGLCSLQIECGEEALPAVCRTYPRSLTDAHAGCTASCERVVEMLMRTEQLAFSEPPAGQTGEYIAALQDRSRPLYERIRRAVAGALPGGLYYNGPTLLSMYAGTLAESSDFMRETVRPVADRYALRCDELRRDSAEFCRAFPDSEAWFENLIVNRMFITDFPSSDLTAAVCGIACEYALLRVTTLGCRDEEEFVDRVSGLYRYIGHTNFNKNSAAALNICGALSKDGITPVIDMFNDPDDTGIRKRGGSTERALRL